MRYHEFYVMLSGAPGPNRPVCDRTIESTIRGLLYMATYTYVCALPYGIVQMLWPVWP